MLHIGVGHFALILTVFFEVNDEKFKQYFVSFVDDFIYGSGADQFHQCTET